ncbi:unnamed protein product [Prorocentrum cordatum]|uniref:B30.2/SPRY domain-containing protein n=1 Tax=Prorocentrum cordatum TaxID=2364126 RepID=A0ABN9RU32_9DINO|nr:unnamed protein product [Polarella glacialis]
MGHCPSCCLPPCAGPPGRSARADVVGLRAGGRAPSAAVSEAGGEEPLASTGAECRREGPDSGRTGGAESAAEAPAVEVRSLAGGLIARVDPAPESVELLKGEIEARCGISAAVQKLMRGTQVLSGGLLLTELQGPPQDLTLVVDECPLFSWDIQGNPNRSLLGGGGHEVHFADEAVDYVNVVTQAPISRGTHLFEFVMHEIGDEQWCGITPDATRAGYRGCDEGCFYYSGRRSSFRGALHAPRERQCRLDNNGWPQYARVNRGDSIGMLLDVDTGAIVFLLNGEVQGGCRVPPQQPWLLTTSLDAEGDRLELRKRPVPDAPDDALVVLQQDMLPRVLWPTAG